MVLYGGGRDEEIEIWSFSPFFSSASLIETYRVIMHSSIGNMAIDMFSINSLN